MRRLISFAVAVAALLLVAPAGAHVYWTNPDIETLGRANTDGSSADQSFVGVVNDPVGVAVTPTHVYWADNAEDAIGEADANGNVQTDDLVDTQWPTGVAVWGNHLYWSACHFDVAGGNFVWVADIGTAKLDGTDAHNLITFDLFHSCPQSIAAAPGPFAGSVALYWQGNVGFNMDCNDPAATHIGRALIENGKVTSNKPCFLSVSEAWGVAANANHVYWTEPDSGVIGRADMDGKNADPSFMTVNPDPASGFSPVGIAVGEGYLPAQGRLYWTDRGAGKVGVGTIGGSVIKSDLVTGASSPNAVAVDPPNQAFRFTQLRPVVQIPQGGHGVLPVVVHSRGTLTLTGPLLKRASKQIGEGGAAVRAKRGANALTANVPVRLKGKAKRRLRRRGTVHVAATVTFRPLGGVGQAKHKHLTLRRQPSRRSALERHR